MIEKFYKLLYRNLPEGQFIEIRLLPPKVKPSQRFFPSLQEFLDYITNTARLQRARREGLNMYFGVNPRARQSGKEEDVAAVVAFWVDIDCKGETKEEAFARLNEFILPPTAIIDSGNGLHAYWFLKEPHEPSQKMKNILRGLASVLKGDPAVSDLSRILRIPGSWNVKDPKNPKLVQILKINETFYNPSDFEIFELQESQKQERETWEEKEPVPEEAVDIMLEHCAFMRHAKEDARTLSEPEWYAMITNLVPVENGEHYIHEFSSPYPNYTPRETDEKIEHAREVLQRGIGPHTCRYIRTLYACPQDCPFGELAKSPVGAALRYLRRRAQRTFEGFLVPEGYSLNGALIQFTDKGDKQIAVSPVWIAAHARSVERNTFHVKLGFFFRGQKEYIWVDRNQIAHTQRLTELASWGFPANSNNARQIIKFLEIFESLNADRLPLNWIVEGFGWKKIEDQLVFVAGKDNIVFEKKPIDVQFSSNIHQDFIEALQPKGKLEDWIVFARAAASYPRVAFLLYASFAAPLIYLLDAENFIIHLYGESSTGKTAAIRLAASVWGNHRKLVKSWNTTNVGLEKLAEQSSGIPLFLDEIQQRNKETPQELIYMFSNAVGKLRGRQWGKGLQQVRHWKTLMFSTGEKALTQSSSYQGEEMRVISLYGTPFEEVSPQAGELIENFVEFTSNTYGVAGVEFVKFLLERKKELRDLYEEEKNKLKAEDGFQRRLANYFAVVALAGRLVEDRFKIGGNVDEVVQAVFAKVIEEKQALGSYLERALEYLASFVAENSHHFDDAYRIGGKAPAEKGYDTYGKIYGRNVAFLPSVLMATLEKAGFNFRRVIEDLHAHGLLETDGDRWGRRKQKTIKIAGVSKPQKVYLIKNLLPEDLEENENNINTENRENSQENANEEEIPF